MNKKLYRNEYNRVRGGVCAGLAEYFEIDVTIVRLLFVLSIFAGGAGIILYIILWIVLPRKGYLYNQFNNIHVDYTVPPTPPENDYYSNNPFNNNPFANNPYSGDPINMPPKQRSHTGVIIGFVLIIIGAAILVNNYDLIPDLDLDKLWPAVLVIIGGAIIVSGQTQKHPHIEDWGKADHKESAQTGNVTDDTTTL